MTSSTATDRLEVRSPANGEIVGVTPISGAAEVAEAVREVAAGHRDWNRTAAGDRAALLSEAAGRLDPHVGELAELQTKEMGKPIGQSRGGVEAGLGSWREAAVAAPLHRGRSLNGGWDATDFMIAEPYGVVAVIAPWNDPVAIALGQTAAALATGNTVVLKPSERAPLAVTRAIELLELPESILRVVNGGPDTGEILVSEARVDLVLHTGSVATGRRIGEASARLGRRAILELGGNDPLIVDAGVDPAWAASQAASGAFTNTGQICTGVERIYVDRRLAEPFTRELVRIAGGMLLGDGLDPETELGPLVDRRMLETVHAQVTEAVELGSRIETGGNPNGNGCFYPPTVLTAVPRSARVLTEETFGPVAPVVPVDSFEEAIDLANECSYGLAANVLTPDQARAQLAWRELEAGTVKINDVWGGAPGGSAQPRGSSGTGYGYGPELMDELTRYKAVHLEPATEP